MFVIRSRRIIKNNVSALKLGLQLDFYRFTGWEGSWCIYNINILVCMDSFLSASVFPFRRLQIAQGITRATTNVDHTKVFPHC